MTLRAFTFVLLCSVTYATQALEQVNLQLKWTHQFQFAGYYVAKEKGFYEQEGLKVNILPADPSNPNPDFKVLYGQAQFGIFHSGILKQRLSGKPFVALAAILQSSPYCWMVKAESDIYEPADFKGKKVSHLGHIENAELLYMLQRAGVNVQTLPLYAGENPIQDFIAGRFDAMQVYSTNEPYVMRQQGIKVREICPKHYGLNVYGDILFTTENVIAQRPDLVQRFRRASLKGWRYAFSYMDEALRITHQQYATHKTMAQLAFEAERLGALANLANLPIGNMSDAKWAWIAELYQLDTAQLQSEKANFIYSETVESENSWSWMLIIAAILTLICVPMYVKLIFLKKNNYQLR
ncbi:ABC transporter substrate-binding protein [Pseudoalteromonas sp. T1lg65]|uniref:ABC transporter substrate-binding protein n=1 Tax=Pseudoalteromonas sp. T1lg65 TaxID=2077101 RepID=UPI003F7AA1D0